MPDTSTTPTEALEAARDYFLRLDADRAQFRDWAGGAADGGPNEDGSYPLTDFTNNVHMVPSPAAIADVAAQAALGAIADDVLAASNSAAVSLVSKTASEVAKELSENAQQGAEAARDEAQAAALDATFYPGARSYVPRGTTSIAITAAGTGGTDGAYICPLTGDNLSVDAYANVTVAGGVVTAASVSAPGLYIGAAPTAGTVDTSAITGLTGATLTPTIGYLVTSGEYYLTDHATDEDRVARYQNQANVAVEVNASVSWLNIAAARQYAAVAESAADDMVRSVGLGVGSINILELTTAQPDKTLNNVTGEIIAGDDFSAFKVTRVYAGAPYRFKKAITYLAAFDASDVLIGAVVAGLAADTEWVAPANVSYVNVAQTTSTLTKPRQAMYLTTTSIANTPYTSPYLVDDATMHRVAFWDALKNFYASSPKSINLVDQADTSFAIGYALGTDGLPTANASYGVTGFIPVIGDGTQPYIGSHTSSANGASLYDENKVFLGTVTNPAGTSWTPSVALGACYYRQQFNLSGGAAPTELGIVPGTTLPSTMPAFGYLNSTSATAISKTQARAAVDDVAAVDRNRFDTLRALDNTSLTASNNTTGAFSNYFVTPYMSVYPGGQIMCNYASGQVVWTDIDGLFITGATPTSFSAQVATTAPAGAYGVRCQIFNMTRKADMSLEARPSDQPFAGDYTVAYKKFGGASVSAPLNWYGKAGYLQGDSQVNNGLFQGTMAAVSGLVITSQGTPGRAMSGAATAIGSVDLSTYDVILNDHGTNDFGGVGSVSTGTVIGTITDNYTVASFYGYMDLWLRNVLNNASYRNKRVAFLGPTPRTDYATNGRGNTLSDYNEAMRTFCKKWHIPFCDLLSTVGFNSYNFTAGSSDLTNDGGHYNAEGGVIVGRIKGNFVNEAL